MAYSLPVPVHGSSSYRSAIVPQFQASTLTRYQGVLPADNRPVIVTERVRSSSAEAYADFQEERAIMQLDHPSLCPPLTCWCEESSPGSYRSITLTDLATPSLSLAISSAPRPWSDYELCSVLKCLVGSLRYVESQGLAHKDICPENVALWGDRVMITNFGVSSGLNEDANSPYQSPELKLGYWRAVDLSKSDVYALGVTMLAMGYLQVPVALCSSSPSESITHNLIEGLGSYPYLQQYLRYMLQSSPESRPSFAALDQWLSPAPQAPFPAPTVIARASAAYPSPSLLRQGGLRRDLGGGGEGGGWGGVWGGWEGGAELNACAKCGQTYNPAGVYPESPFCSGQCYMEWKRQQQPQAVKGVTGKCPFQRFCEAGAGLLQAGKVLWNALGE